MPVHDCINSLTPCEVRLPAEVGPLFTYCRSSRVTTRNLVSPLPQSCSSSCADGASASASAASGGSVAMKGQQRRTVFGRQAGPQRALQAIALEHCFPARLIRVQIGAASGQFAGGVHLHTLVRPDRAGSERVCRPLDGMRCTSVAAHACAAVPACDGSQIPHGSCNAVAGRAGIKSRKFTADRRVLAVRRQRLLRTVISRQILEELVEFFFLALPRLASLLGRLLLSLAALAPLAVACFPQSSSSSSSSSKADQQLGRESRSRRR